MSWFIQAKYPTDVRGQAPDGWVTVAVSERRLDAARRASHQYRERDHPDDGLPEQVRIRSEAQLREHGGDESVEAAAGSLLAYGRVVA